MKFTLLLCISLLFSLFHAAAMPISNTGHAPMKTEASMVNHMSFHCDNIMQDDLKMQHCCSGVALHAVASLQIMSHYSQEKYTSLSPRLIKQIPDVLFKPPKFSPVVG